MNSNSANRRPDGDAPLETLPTVGFSRWSQLKRFIPVSHETWRKLVKQGRAPQPQRWSQRCTVYRNEEVHLWMKNPNEYQVQVTTEKADSDARRSASADAIPADGVAALKGVISKPARTAKTDKTS
ncbi:helix-turn-helix transcriptional regulator [Trinickia violacea]|uniref:helix-turn-helix transcriptional regulator n=1 Tax=Trinickia violacea TaxID=2571746 RepID=UPI0020C762F9|nr:hypothetical protein [Trinickia violacea]